MKMLKVPVTSGDLSQQLSEQINFIRASCTRFDEGQTSEGKRIATHIRVLVHDSSRSHSLLKQLGYKDTLQLVSLAEPYIPANLAPYHGLLNIAIGNGMRYVPKLDSVARRLVPFDDWWDEPVLKDPEGTLYSRKDLVLAVANKDGGTHVDPEIDEAYWKLSRGNNVGYKVAVGGRPIQWHENPVLPSLRQIGFEILETLDSMPEAKHS